MIYSSKYNKYLPKYKRIFAIAAILGCLYAENNVQSQDIHFSQFYATPILLNPASTGMSGDNFRIANNFRNQWGKIGTPYRTFYTSIDTKLTIANQSFGIGGVLVHDQSSAYNLAANEFFISLSYSKIINNHQFSIGIQPGFAFRSYNMNGMTFGSQFDPSNLIFNPGLPNAESNLADNLRYFDLNVGVYWRTLIKNIMPSAGISISHLFKPEVNFSSSGDKSYLPMKLTFHGQVNIPLTSKVVITPSMLYSSVPGANEFLLGGIVGYAVNDFFFPVKKIYALTLIRMNPFRNIDAMILGGGVKFSKFDLGISYDINVSPLSKASFFNGAFEVSLIFTGGQTRKNAYEPCYIY